MAGLKRVIVDVEGESLVGLGIFPDDEEELRLIRELRERCRDKEVLVAFHGFTVSIVCRG